MIPNEETLAALQARRDQPRLIARNAGSEDGFSRRADPQKP